MLIPPAKFQANQSSPIKPMHDINRADLDVEFVVTGFAFAGDNAIAVGSWRHMDSNAKLRVIQPGDIKVEKHHLQMLLLDADILAFLLGQEAIVNLVDELVGLRMVRPSMDIQYT